MFDTLGWRWEYEPDLQAGYVIPDFLLPSFMHAVIVECKPVLTIGEIVEHRQALINKLKSWLRHDVLREIEELDGDPGAPVELTDLALDDLVRVACGNNPRSRSRRILVVGPYLHLDGVCATVDGIHGFCVCRDEPAHVGLTAALGTHCLVCGQMAEEWADSATMLQLWRTSQNEVQWNPG